MGHLVFHLPLFHLPHLHLLLLWHNLVEARMQIDLVSILLGLMVTFVQLKVSGRLLHRSCTHLDLGLSCRSANLLILGLCWYLHLCWYLPTLLGCCWGLHICVGASSGLHHGVPVDGSEVSQIKPVSSMT